MSDHEYPKPSLTADVVTFSLDDEGKLAVLLIQRAKDPFAGRWAIPGGFCEPKETVLESAARELVEETGIQGLHIEELGAYSKPGRDPRGWVVSIAHIAVLPPNRKKEAKGSDDAHSAKFFTITEKVRGESIELQHGEEHSDSLAFDHDEILRAALHRLEERAETLMPLLLNQPLTTKEAKNAFALSLGRNPK